MRRRSANIIADLASASLKEKIKLRKPSETPNRIVVTVAGKIIADTKNALTLRDASYPAVFCIPRADDDIASLERTGYSICCPYKGDIPLGGERTPNAVWTYEALFDAVASIKDHLAFYTDRVDSFVEHAAV